MRRYAFIDWATQGYCALVAVLITLFHGDAVPGWGWRVAAHGLCLLVVHALLHAQAARPHHRGLAFLRHFYPVLLYAGFYSETGQLNQMFATGYLDGAFHRWDEQLFGFSPSLAFMAAFPGRLLSEVFYGAYFSYYLMIFGVGLALYLRDHCAFLHYLSVTSLVFYACYVIYLFLPVVGPRIFYPDLVGFALPAADQPAHVPGFPGTVQAGFFYRLMEVIYARFETPGAAFPSSHVAIALVTLRFSFRHLRPIRWIHLTLVVLLCVATVYCRYHYAIDVAAGLATTALLLPLADRLYARWGDETAPVGRS
jgi:membrane-associated phospholipid phosphatase